MAKLKPFSNEFDVHYSRASSPWTGAMQHLLGAGGSLLEGSRARVSEF